MVFESHYFWFNQLIAWYIKHDYVFAKSKIFHHKKIEILSSIPESGLYVHSFLINFPAYLPESRKYDNMIVIVNYLSKKKQFFTLSHHSWYQTFCHTVIYKIFNNYTDGLIFFFWNWKGNFAYIFENQFANTWRFKTSCSKSFNQKSSIGPTELVFI